MPYIILLQLGIVGDYIKKRIYIHTVVICEVVCEVTMSSNKNCSLLLHACHKFSCSAEIKEKISL